MEMNLIIEMALKETTPEENHTQMFCTLFIILAKHFCHEFSIYFLLPLVVIDEIIIYDQIMHTVCQSNSGSSDLNGC